LVWAVAVIQVIPENLKVKIYLLLSATLKNLNTIFVLNFEHNMKSLILVTASLITLILLCSCSKNKIDACANFDQVGYLVADTIYLDATCSENVDEFLWTPKEGLMMLGNGKTSTERFIILPLPGMLSRSIELKVSNSKSSRIITKSTIIL
jgi:hypothetical protein